MNVVPESADRYEGLIEQFIPPKGGSKALLRTVNTMVDNLSYFYGWTPIQFYREAHRYYGQHVFHVYCPNTESSWPNIPTVPDSVSSKTMAARHKTANAFLMLAGPAKTSQPRVNHLTLEQFEVRLAQFHDAVMRSNDGVLTPYQLAIYRAMDQYGLPPWRLWIDPQGSIHGLPYHGAFLPPGKKPEGKVSVLKPTKAPAMRSEDADAIMASSLPELVAGNGTREGLEAIYADIRRRYKHLFPSDPTD